jgi:hypothetical protein
VEVKTAEMWRPKIEAVAHTDKHVACLTYVLSTFFFIFTLNHPFL